MKQRITDELILDRQLVQRVLSFFNSVSHPMWISKGIKDDYWYGVMKGRGITDRIAQEVMELRATLPDQRFTSLEQIRSVHGIGEDTMVDIVTTFGYAINQPLAYVIVEFFNEAPNETSIQEAIRDDPDFGSRRGVGITRGSRVATRILAARDRMPDKRFESIYDIQDIGGIGRDTMHDIIYTFANRGDAGIPDFGLRWGTGNREFHFPFDVGVDPSGNVYVMDTNNHRVQKLDPGGAFLAKWGEKGTGPGQFYYARGLAVDSGGNVYVSDSTNHRIQKFDANGNFIIQWGQLGVLDGGFDTPEGIACDAAGNVCVADSGNHRIQRFDPNGNFIDTFGSAGSDPGEFMFPSAVTVDGNADIFVADSLNHRIQKFDPLGNLLDAWGSAGSDGGQFQHMRGLAIGRYGDLYVADTTGNHRIQRLEPFGPFLLMWGGFGTGDGQFNTPDGIATDGGDRVYVADTQNHRIQVFDPWGGWVATWAS